MKFLIISVALLGVVAADVKHLSNMYLPPHIGNVRHKSVEYAQQSQEIPQSSQSFGAPVEITDNSVTAQVETQEQAAEQQYFNSNKIDNLNYGAGSVQSNTEENKYYTGAIAVPHPEIPQVEAEEQKYFTGSEYKQGQEDSATTTTNTGSTAETSVPAPGSDAFTQQQAAFYTSINQQQEAEAPADEGSIEPSVPAPDSDTYTQQQAAYYTGQGGSSTSTSTSTVNHVEQVSQEPESINYNGGSSGSTSTSTSTHVEQGSQDSEQKYYTGLNAPTQGSSASVSTSTTINAEASSPGSDDVTQQQAAYFTQQSQQSQEGLAYNNAQEVGGTTQLNYNTGVVYNQGQEPGHTTTVVEEQSVSVSAPGPDDFTQQQAVYRTSVDQQQESAAPALGATSGIDTQYAANGGYVY